MTNPGAALRLCRGREDLLVLAAAAPFLIFAGPWSPTALAAFVVIELARLLGRRHRRPSVAADSAIALLCVAVTVSLYVSFDLALSLPKLYGILLGVFLYRTLARSIPDAVTLGLLATATVLGGVAVVAAGLLGTGWFDEKVIPVTAITRHLPQIAAAPLSRSAIPAANVGIHPNELAGTLVLLLPPTVLVGASLTARTARIATLLIAGAMIVVLLLTQSRSGWFGVLAAGAAWCLARLVGPRAGVERVMIQWRSARPPSRAALVLLAVTAVAWAILALIELAPTMLLWLDGALGDTRSGVSRFEVWLRTVDLLQEFPLTGVGLNAFPFVLGTFFPPFRSAPGEVVAHAHNQYLATFADVGAPGFAALALLAAIALRDGAASLRLTGLPGGLARGCVLGLLGFWCYGLTDAIALGAKPGLFVWLEMGVLRVSAELARQGRLDERRLPTPPAPSDAASLARELEHIPP